MWWQHSGGEGRGAWGAEFHRARNRVFGWGLNDPCGGSGQQEYNEQGEQLQIFRTQVTMSNGLTEVPRASFFKHQLLICISTAKIGGLDKPWHGLQLLETQKA